MSRKLQRARNKQLSSLSVTIGNTDYLIDLERLTQQNTATSAKRKLQVLEPKNIWAYSGERHGEWCPCDTNTCAALAKAQLEGQSVVKLTVGGKQHEYDLKARMLQDLSTRVVRRLRCVRCKMFAFEDGRPGSDNWRPCDDETCFALTEGANAGRRLLEHDIGRTKYRFDLLQLTQTNVDTNYVRQLKVASSPSGWLPVCSRPCLGRWVLLARDGASSPAHARLRRHALLVMLATFAWFGAVTVAAVLLWSNGQQQLMNTYGSSITFLGCVMQMFCGAACSKLAACRATGSDIGAVALHSRLSNTTAALVMGVVTLLTALEGQGLVGERALTADGASASDAATFRALNLAVVSALGLSMALHANLALQAHLLILSARREHAEKAKGPPPTGETVICIVDDDGSRVQLEPEQAPVDDATYVMYHGTDPQAAEQIERYGFLRSKDGMLGPGVYLSRDIMKAAHYPLHVPALQQHGRVIFECLVQVGKVKRIDCKGHALQKTWSILGYDTAWVPPNCGVTPSGLEEDCVAQPSRIRILRRVKVEIHEQPPPPPKPRSPYKEAPDGAALKWPGRMNRSNSSRSSPTCNCSSSDGSCGAPSTDLNA